MGYTSGQSPGGRKMQSADCQTTDIPFKALYPFLFIAFGLVWGITAVLILFAEQVEAVFGALSMTNPLFILAVYAPAIAAFVLVPYFAGATGFRGYFGRMSLWRCSRGWALFLIIGIPALFYAGALAKGADPQSLLPTMTLAAAIPALAVTAIIGPMEEFGWRGVALPLLQRRFAPIWAALILGVIWGLWHAPAFILSGTPQSGWSFVPFVIGSIAISIIVTPLFNSSGGSILLPAIAHYQLNNPLWPDAQPHDTWFFVGAALAVIWVCRKQMFARKAGVTTVVPLARPSQKKE